MGPILNIGSPSPLNLACSGTDIQRVQKFLKFGGKPFQPGDKGVIPAVAAAETGSPEILEYLLSQTEVDLKVEDGRGRNVALAGALSGHPQKIKALKKAGATFPQKVTRRESDLLRDRIWQYLLFKNDKAIEELLAWNQGHSKAIEEIIISSTFIYLIKRKDEEGIKNSLKTLEVYSESIQKFLESKEGWIQLFEKKNFSMAKIFFEKTELPSNLALNLWKAGKATLDTSYLQFLESIGAEFKILEIEGKEHFCIVQNKKALAAQPIDTFEKPTSQIAYSEFPEYSNFYEFLHQRGLPK